MKQLHYQYTVIALLVIALILAIDFPARSAIPKLVELNQYQREELALLRKKAEGAVESEGRVDDRPCSAEQLKRVPYTEWFKASVSQVGGFEPYSILLNLERIDTKVNFAQPMEMPGVDLNQDAAAHALDDMADKHCQSFQRFWDKSGLDALTSERHVVDLAILYMKILENKPQRIVEIGSGITSLVIAHALAESVKRSPRETPVSYVIIDPSPNGRYVARAQQHLSNHGGSELRLIAERADSIMISEWSLFENLARGDILIADTARAYRLDSDSPFVMLNIVPRLAVGVHIAYVETYLPYHYPRDLIINRRLMWTEQYFLNLLLSTSQSAIAVATPTYLLWTTNDTDSLDACGITDDLVAPPDDRCVDCAAPLPAVSDPKAVVGGVVSTFTRTRPRAITAQSGVRTTAAIAAEVNAAVDKPTRRRPALFWITKLKKSVDEDDSPFASSTARDCVFREIDSWMHPVPRDQRSKCTYAL